jgi:hypothetical protein
MKHIATAALMLSLGVAGINAQPGPVNMTLSGSSVGSTITLQGTPADEYQLTGNGPLGSFHLRVVSISRPSSPAPISCSSSSNIYLSAVDGAAVFSQGGDVLKLHLTGGSDCIDVAANHALCIRSFLVTGGSGRFAHASGALTLTMTVAPVLADGPPTNPVFFSVNGTLTGLVAGVAADQGSQNSQE